MKIASSEALVAHVPMRALANTEVLAARKMGEAHRSSLERKASLARLVVLDFAGVEALTASYFLGGPWVLWSRPDRAGAEAICVVANLLVDGVEELDLLARVNLQPMWCGRWTRGRFRDARLVGAVDTIDAEIVDQVAEVGEITANNLAESSRHAIGVTGWNNRLAGLHLKKILRRRRDGRQNVYELPWKE